jgi:hypothetical protein
MVMIALPPVTGVRVDLPIRRATPMPAPRSHLPEGTMIGALMYQSPAGI